MMSLFRFNSVRGFACSLENGSDEWSGLKILLLLIGIESSVLPLARDSSDCVWCCLQSCLYNRSNSANVSFSLPSMEQRNQFPPTTHSSEQ